MAPPAIENPHLNQATEGPKKSQMKPLAMKNPHLNQATEVPKKLSNGTPGHGEPASKSGHGGGKKADK